VKSGAPGRTALHRRLDVALATVATGLGLAGCGGGGSGEPRVQAVSGSTQAGFAGNYAGTPVVVRVVDESGDAVGGTTVTFTVTGGNGVLAGGSAVTNASGEAALGSWRFGTGASQQVTATALGASTTFDATTTPVPASAFSIEVRFPGPPPSAAVQAALAASANRWRQVIVGDLPDIVLSGNDRVGPIEINTGIPNVGTITCVPRLENQTIDDMVIYADIRPIDGTTGSNILGFALPVVGRDDFTTVAGCMVFDEANLAQLDADGRLGDLVLHEMAHVIGFGTIWGDNGLLVGGCSPGLPEPYFTGSSARQAFTGSLTSAFTGSIVPVEGNGSCNGGTRDSHWRETVFDDELMTGFIEISGPNLLSAVTAASLRDIRYEVNDAAADDFSMLRTGAAAARTAGTRVELVEPRIQHRPHIVDPRGRRLR
jgi:hypothetical protein